MSVSKHDMRQLSNITEAYSIEALEELLRQRKKATEFVATWGDSEYFINHVAKLTMPAHQEELAQRRVCEHNFYCDFMRIAFGQDYFEKLETLHGYGRTGLELADQHDMSVYQKMSDEWINNKKGSGSMFSDCKSTARAAYMEALANMDGRTIYEHLARKDA